MQGRGLAAIVVSLILCSGACGDDSGGADGPMTRGPFCAVDELTDALEQAEAGDTVLIGECEVEASLALPSGVTLSGAGVGASMLAVPTGTVGIRLAANAAAGASEIRDLSISGSDTAAIVVTGQGDVTIADVGVEVEIGLGIAVLGVDQLNVADVSLTGVVDPSVEAGEVNGDATSVNGLEIKQVGKAVLSNVTAEHFFRSGVTLLDSDVEWAGGGTRENMSLGIQIWGGTANLVDVEACGTRLDGSLASLAAGLLIADGAVVTTDGVVLDDNNYGLVQDQSSSDNTNLRSRNNGNGGLWVQSSLAFGLVGPNSLIGGNTARGVYVYESAGVDISEASIESTVLRPGVGAELGDGLQLVTSEFVISGIVLTDNERVGLVIDEDTPGSFDGSSILGVTVTGSGEQLGAILQDYSTSELTPPDGAWDAGITRMGATVANDSALLGALNPQASKLNLVGPNSFF